jgi:hypothetical protein
VSEPLAAAGPVLDTPWRRRHPAPPGQDEVPPMRLEYGFELSEIQVPRFSVEAVEGIGKLFTLATLMLNVLEKKKKVEVVFHGLNPEDPEHKLEAFKEIVSGSATAGELHYELGSGGHVAGSSSYFRWVTVTRA